MVIHVRNLMTRRVVTVSPTDPIEHAVEMFWLTGFSSLPVVDEGLRVVGMVTAGHLLQALGRDSSKPQRLRPSTVGGAMARTVVTGSPRSDVAALAAKMAYSGIRAVPITHRDSTLAGILTRSDLLRRRPAGIPTLPVRGAPGGPLAADIMTPVTRVRTIGESDPADTAVNILNHSTFTALPVLNEREAGRLVGLISEADLDWRGHGRTAGTVGQLMTTEVITRALDTHITELAQLMYPGGLRVVPIVENERLLGVVSRSDLLHPSSIPHLRAAPSIS